ncbi:gliding motility-associated C-terminal domain-containing protein [Chryseobacterium taeanense]|uniref:Gliding motility-associated C-terminal domain-containing protein n=1 Tax=Chryseobacterium taeanense TaxID=311334 RepID=A0A1G8PB09_9FLAO|nr:T9SS type B sorting domain-containing protein [Chryseobacterium taeanense]SDI88910.1 gliding motility-associated C-terminal domain-containing protein [Chryseobacterium taeanense]
MKKLLLLTVLFFSQMIFSQSDCVSAIAVCGNAGQSYTPSGHGTTQESPLGGCLSTEHFSVWYKFTIATGGTLTFVINPNATGTSTDYDWAVYGPNVQCGALGLPVRCSFSAGGGPTGLNMTSLDTSESASVDNLGNDADRFVKYMDVLPGETYYLIVDNFSSNTTGFALEWGGTATLASPFNDPNLTPNPFVPPGNPSATPNGPNEIVQCQLPTTFDFSTLTAGIVNGNANFQVTYHYNSNDAIIGASPITTPITINGTDTYYYSIHYQDPTNPNNPINSCTQTGAFKFVPGNIVTNNATLTSCNYNNSGIGIFDLTSASVYAPTAGVTKKYYPSLADMNAGTNEITNPGAYSSAAPKTIYVKINTDQGCYGNAEILLQFLPPLPAVNVTLKACNNNNSGTGLYDLTSANVYPPGNVTKKYYSSLADLNAGTNAITNPASYISAAPKTIYVRVTNPQGCTGQSEISLQYFPVVTVTEATLESCFIETATATATFDLTQANVTSQTAVVKAYFTTQADALAGTNPIANPSNYISTTTTIYIRVSNENDCFAIAKVNLKVLPPVKSSVLKDKIICIEDKTTLDAGPGFDGYEWSTGATTQSISNVGAGEYWVRLKTGKCWTLQEVKVNASAQPVITNIDINNDSFTVSVAGGKGPYQYSLDGINWQDSNVFTGLPRGENKVYVKDAYDCNPISVQVTVPNLINAITPNGDNKNDYIDYSALSYKKNVVFTVYDRYGNMMYRADKIRNYTWDGTSNGKKIMTGTYWYTITWTENDKNNTETKYSGWVLVKNIQ